MALSSGSWGSDSLDFAEKLGYTLLPHKLDEQIGRQLGRGEADRQGAVNVNDLYSSSKQQFYGRDGHFYAAGCPGNESPITIVLSKRAEGKTA